ncbi:MAG: hypothetical protein V4631_22305 [Pseudomonadota bacterium]
MQIENLQIELRPRTNAQALDLGFALLRSHASAAYLAFAALWVPLLVLAGVLTWLLPALGWLWVLVCWWVKPLLERAPLYVLSRQVFGTTVSWQEAVRAWPRQLGGGSLRLVTWGRLLSAGRALYQPIWQLEMARGKVANSRIQVLGKHGTAGSAVWFGVVCFWLMVILELGILGFLGLFASDSELTNPFAVLIGMGDRVDLGAQLLKLAIYGLAEALMAPVYTASGFTLYLNRRAALEAWDLEMQLRQIKRPATPRARGAALGTAAALLLTLTLAMQPDAALAAAPAATCKAPESTLVQRGAVNGERQAALRRQVDLIYQGKDLRGYDCVEVWRAKDKSTKEKKATKTSDFKGPDLSTFASVMKAVIIAIAIGLIAWLLYRYRHLIPAMRPRSHTLPATSVAGLDIRAESLPDDVARAVRALWAEGRRRAALALLYRSTLSRLVTEDALALRRGNTEGDCLRLAQAAQQAGRLSAERLAVATASTGLWLGAAYGDRWPDDAVLEAACRSWNERFGIIGGRAA